MPQQHLPGLKETPYGFSFKVEADPLDPDAPLVFSITTTDAHGHPLRSKSMSLVGIEADFLGEIAKASAEAYLWGDGWTAPFLAAAHLRRAAREHRLRHAARS